jgi:hypothetical protein
MERIAIENRLDTKVFLLFRIVYATHSTSARAAIYRTYKNSLKK